MAGRMVHMESAKIERATCSPMVIPYFAEKHHLPHDILPKIYQRLVADDILSDLVPENELSEEDFIEFVTGPALLSLFLDVASGRWAGIAWITQVEEGRFIKKGCASIAFFRDWWKPRVTYTFGRTCLRQWFEILGFDMVYAMTPANNRLAIRYTERLGFEYRATLPRFTSRAGEICDGKIAMMTKDEFYAKESAFG